MESSKTPVRLKMLPLERYKGGDASDPIKYYYWPVIGALYRRRVEMCLAHCKGGERALEVGFGSGICFLSLHTLYKKIYGIDLETDIHQVLASFDNEHLPLELKNGSVLHLDYPDKYFDTVLLISILEHLRPAEQMAAFKEIHRVLKPGGQVVFGAPVERPFMVNMFRLMGVDIRQHHFSTHLDIAQGAKNIFTAGRLEYLRMPLVGNLYLVGDFSREGE